MATYRKLLKNKAGDTIIPITDRDIYSTSETIVGTWINGKPIYRKVINITSQFSLPVNGTWVNTSYTLPAQGLHFTRAVLAHENGTIIPIIATNNGKTTLDIMSMRTTSMTIGAGNGAYFILEYTNPAD